MGVNQKIKHEGDRMQTEFKYIEKWLFMEVNGQKRFKVGVDVGCGTNRLALDKDIQGENPEVIVPGILSVDKQSDPRYAQAQIIWDCSNLDFLADKTMDFIFSSHCLEDFTNIPVVFESWWKKLKQDGLMILLLPDMADCTCEHCKGKSRYPKVGEANGNPAHRTNITKEFVNKMLQALQERNKIKYEILQSDTIPHNESCSIDFVIKKTA